jgi:hypothetical protein
VFWFESSDKMAKTCYQTVEVYYGNSEKRFFTCNMAPPRPKKALKCPKVVKYYRGVVTTWYPDRTEVYYSPTNITQIYWNRPTLQDVLNWSFTGQYYRKHSDGVVEWGYSGHYYRWESDIEVIDEPGGYTGCECEYDHPHDPNLDDEEYRHVGCYCCYGSRYYNN